MQNIHNHTIDTLYDLHSLGLIQVSGSDAKKLLQGQLTCDIEKITSTKSNITALCNRQGRVISLLYLFFFKEVYYLLIPRCMIALTLRALKKYAIFYKNLILQEMNDQFIIKGLKSNAVSPMLFENNHCAFITIPQDSTRFIIVAEPFIIEQYFAAFPTSSSEDAWIALDISHRIPMLYPQTSEKCLAHELRLYELNGIDFDKGCYTGQEIIARMHYRGKLKKHLYQATITSDVMPVPGTDIYYLKDETPIVCGMIITVSALAAPHYQVLFIADDHHAKNSKLFFSSQERCFSIQMEYHHDACYA